MRKLLIAGAGAIGASLLLVSSALAAYSLFGSATIVSPGAAGSAHAVEVNGTSTFGGVSFTVPSGTTFAEIDQLATDYRFSSIASCTGGSPRFQVRVMDPTLGARNIFVYLGTPPAYSPCPAPVYVNTGDLLEGLLPIDTSQLTNGTFYDPYATALGKYGSYMVLSVSLVVDGGYGQIVRFDNTNVGGTIYTYDHPINMDDCKNGGWQNLTRTDGTSFKNQGDCVSYTNTGR